MPPTIAVTLPGGRVEEVPFGTSVAEVLGEGPGGPPVAAVLNGEPVNLGTLLTEPARVAPILLSDRTGFAIYARSVCYLLALAVYELFPGRKLVVEHSINTEVFATLDGGRHVTTDEVARLLAHMRDLVATDAPIERLRVPREQALRTFADQGMTDKTSLLQSVNQPYVSVYRCRGYHDYLFGTLVPSLGRLRTFDVQAFAGGILVLLPDKKNLDRIPPRSEIPKLRATFRETERWAHILGAQNVGGLNEKLSVDEGRDLILVAEGLHEKKISQIADAILIDIDRTKLVLIAGPSSSGKTTFSKRLSIQLRVLGLEPFPIAADDYFLPHALTPRDADGNYDFESLAALDVAALSADLTTLLAGGEIELVRFDFVAGTRVRTGRTYRMNDRSVLIVEGIHGLNDAMTPDIPPEAKYRVYCSSLTPLNMDDHTAIFVSDVRTLRRIIRDARTRGKSAEGTLTMWPSVRAGEEKHIFPYQEHADVMFNSSLLYEINALQPHVQPLLEAIDHDSPVYVEASRLLKLLRFFRPASERYIPANSIIREFIGGSCFD
nr:nucleoside kinase [Propionibacterium sp.]